jgi:hypothetical protein
MILNPENTNILLAYRGPFCIDILSNLGNYIKWIFEDQPTTGKKLYKLFFELSQNVAKYSAESIPVSHCRFSGVGSFSLEEVGEKVILSTSNLIRNEDGPVLIEYCSEINSMDKTHLRKYKNEKRKQLPDSRDMGAHLGIIQIGLLTFNNINFNIEKINEEHALFNIYVTIIKE